MPKFLFSVQNIYPCYVADQHSHTNLEDFEVKNEGDFSNDPHDVPFEVKLEEPYENYTDLEKYEPELQNEDLIEKEHLPSNNEEKVQSRTKTLD